MKSQTLKLLKKELLLGNSLQTIIWTFCCFCMFFIPSYPMYVGPFYITLGIMMSFAMNQASNDILYTVLLPVKKIDVVKARFLYCGFLELISFVAALIALPVRILLQYPENKAGIGLTICWFGFQMIVYSVFNLIFLGNVYKNPIKPGVRFLAGATGYFLTYFIFEIPIWSYYSLRAKIDMSENSKLPFISWIGERLSKSDSECLLPHIYILAAGFLIYAVSWYITFRRAANQFEKYDM